MIFPYSLLSLVSLSASAGSWSDPEPFTLSAKELTELQSKAVAAETDAPVYLPFERIEYTYDAEGRETQTVHRIYVIRSKDALDGWGQVIAHWAPWQDNTPTMKARVLSPEGVLAELDPSTVSENTSSERDPTIFSDSRVMRAPLPGLRVGSLVEELVVNTEHTPFISGGASRLVSLRAFNEVQHRTVRVWTDASLPLEWEVVESDVKAKPLKDKGRRGVELVMSPAPEFDSIPANLPSTIAGYPHLRFSTSPSWSTIGTAYGELLATQSDRKGLGPIVERIRGEGGDPRQLVDRAYEWVRDEVRYTGVSFGDRAIVPYPPATVLERGFGDCKDKALLLVSILDELGIPAQVALLDANSGDDLDVNPDYPGANRFNHAIVYVPEQDLWLDPTSSESSLALPWSDAGRYALLTGSKSKLVRTPAPTPDHHTYREVRQITLPLLDYGTVVERSTGVGWPVEGLREDFASDNEEAIQGGLEEYGVNAYGTSTVTNITVGNASDMTQPFDLTATFEEATWIEGGGIDGLVEVYRSNIIEHLPGVLTRAIEEGDEDPLSERTVDIACFPVRAELVLEIDRHPLYVPRALPESTSVQHGPVRLDESYVVEDDGDVIVTWTVEATGEDLTVEQARALREDAQAWKDVFSVSFTQVGASLTQRGEFAAVFAAYNDALSGDPEADSALLGLRSETLVSRHMGFAAVLDARAQTEANPSSPAAWGNLGYALLHDDWGRTMGLGFDRAGAIHAFEEALRLGSTDMNDVQNLGFLYRTDAQRVLYNRGAQLDKAVELFLAHRDDLSPDLRTALAQDLTIAGRPTEALTELDTLTLTVQTVGIRTAALAMVEGPEPAVQKLDEMGLTNKQRTEVLTRAGNIFQWRRNHQLASAMFLAASTSSTAPVQSRRTATVHANAHPWEDDLPDGLTAATRDPELLPLAFMAALFYDDATTVIPELITESLQSNLDHDTALTEKSTLAVLQKGNFTSDLMADLLLSSAESQFETAGKRLRRATVVFQGAPPTQAYLQRVGREWRMASSSTSPAYTAQLAWTLAKEGDRENAVTVLHWAMEDADWRETFRKAVSESTVQQWAAVVMLAGDPTEALTAGIPDAESLLPQLSDATQIDVVRDLLARGYKNTGRWEDVIDVLEPRIDLEGRDPAPILNTTTALRMLDRDAEAEQLLTSMTATELPMWTFELGLHHTKTGNIAAARAIFSELERSPQRPDSLLNNLAWNHLFEPSDPARAVALIERQAGGGGALNANRLHTLAVAYLHNGQPDLAASALTTMVQQSDPAKPIGTEWWLVKGGLCEAYGLRDCALQAYDRAILTDPAKEAPTSTSVLARQEKARLLATPQ